MKKLLLASFLSFAVGCSGVNYLGRVGDTKFYSVHNSKLDGPNFNTLVSETDGQVNIDAAFAGPGILTSLSPAIVNAAGNVGAASVLRPDHTEITSSGGTASGGRAVATGGKASGGTANAVAKDNSDNTSTTTTNNDINKVNSDNSTSNTVQENNVNVGK